MPTDASLEVSSNWALGDIKATAAWRSGSAGQGVLIGIVDSGADSTHPELVGRVSPASQDLIDERNRLYDASRTHGSMIASAIAGNFNSQYTVGIAFGATVLALRSDAIDGGYYDTETANAIDYAVAQGAHVVNISLGGFSSSSLSLQAALRRATEAGVIIVVSAGNNSSSEVSYPARYAGDARFGGLILAVGAHGQAHELMSFSNRAGETWNYFLTAPGTEVPVPAFDSPDCAPAPLCVVAGTSITAPQVTGAIATLLAAFPALPPREIVNLLLTTADDMGEVGTDRVWGHGRLNLERAFAPVGTLLLPLGASEIPADTTLGVAGAAFGDALTRDPAAWQAVAFDAFDRAFVVDLSSAWQPAPRVPAPLVVATADIPSLTGTRAPTTPATMLTAAGFAGYERELPQVRQDVVASRISLPVGPDLDVTIAANRTPVAPLTLTEPRGHFGAGGASAGVALTRSFATGRLTIFADALAPEPNRLFGGATRQAYAMQYQRDVGAFASRVSIGYLREQGALLGLDWSPAVGEPPRASSSFLGAAMRWTPLPGLSIAAAAELGSTSPRLSGWIDVAQPLLTSAFAADLSWAATPRAVGRADRAALGHWFLTLRQPLRIERGTLALTLPVATIQGRAGLGQITRTLQATPSGRELEFGIGYELRTAARVATRLEFRFVQDPGHVAAASLERVIELQLRLPLP
ncbi:MAG: S8 family serine peptidase [Gammaproteobacteria bacterium]|nr:S8 family serine peptidase [Gammaproteobacteria bacterium]